MDETEKLRANKEKSQTIKISKRNLYLGTFVILVVILLLLSFFVFLPKYKNNNELKEYKRALYDSISCQYACPLSEQTYLNQTQFLPNVECVRACINELKSKGVEGKKFSDNDLLNDNLFEDIETIIQDCRTSTKENQTNSIANNTIFFDCTKIRIDSLKQNYSYLK